MEFGPMMKMALQALGIQVPFGVGGGVGAPPPSATPGFAPPGQNPDMAPIESLRDRLKNVPVIGPMIQRPGQQAAAIDVASGGGGGEQMFPNQQVAPGALSPEQQSDWYQVGLGNMRISEFKQKHGFVPANQ